MIIVTGSVAWDFIIDFPGKFGDHILPDQIHKLNISFNVDHYAKRRGGTAANAAYNMHLLGASCKLFAMVGLDFDEYKKAYDEKKIDTSSVVVDTSTYCSTGFGITDRSNNQIWGYSYGATAKAKTLQLKSVATQKDLVLAGPASLSGMMNIVKQSAELGISYMFDPSFGLADMSDTQLSFGIKHASYVVGNDYEMMLIKNRLKNWEKLFSGKTIITTLGQKGAVIESSGKKYIIKTAKPKKIVDPTGAGDAWRAGFLAGLDKGFDMQTCGQMGAVAASFALEKYGTQEHSYTLPEFKNRYRQAYGSLLKL